jgi:hypothetical protein
LVIKTSLYYDARSEKHQIPKDMLKRYVKRDVKMPCKQISLSIGAPLGNLERIRLPGLLEKRGWYIWVPVLDP